MRVVFLKHKNTFKACVCQLLNKAFRCRLQYDWVVPINQKLTIVAVWGGALTVDVPQQIKQSETFLWLFICVFKCIFALRRRAHDCMRGQGAPWAALESLKGLSARLWLFKPRNWFELFAMGSWHFFFLFLFVTQMCNTTWNMFVIS